MRWVRVTFLVAAFLGSAFGGDDVTPLVRGPYLQSLLDTSVEVLWHTEIESLGRVEFGLEGGERRSAEEGAPATRHRVRLTDLPPSTVITYEIFAGDESLNEGNAPQFRTAPPPGEGSIRFAALGDSGTGSDGQLMVAGILRDLAPDMILHMGDVTYTGEWDTSVFGPYGDILSSTCMFAAKGNHDRIIAPEEPNFEEIFLRPDPPAGPAGNPSGKLGHTYSFDWGPAHVTVIDTALFAFLRDLDPELLDWLDRDLAKARELPSDGEPAKPQWLVVVLHHPPFNIGVHAIEAPDMRELVEPIFSRHNVDLVLSGDDHNYQRSYPVHDGVIRDAWQEPTFESPLGTIYLVTGGGGRFLYDESYYVDRTFTRLFVSAFHLLDVEITGDQLSVRAITKSESSEDVEDVIDSFTISKGTPRPLPALLRGDLNQSGDLGITDPILLLNFLFLGRSVPCPAAGDVETLGTLGIGDAIFVLNFLFLGTAPPPPPYPDCGPADGVSDAGCVREGS